MATRKNGSKDEASARTPVRPEGFGITSGSADADTAYSSAHSTVSGPASLSTSAAQIDAATAKLLGAEAVAAAFPSNAAKASEYADAANEPAAGQAVEPPHPMVTGSTLTEVNASPKVGSGNPPMGFNPGSASLNRVRVDSGGRALTTNQGVPVADNQNSLKSGVRGPALLEDFILREKITHFDHERIPERIVHARGSGAHGYRNGWPMETSMSSSRRIGMQTDLSL